jgi:oligopeptidase B
MVLLERGYSVTYAHCRGGGEYGQSWHDDGKQMNKWKTFEDFATCAEHLITRSYTIPSLLCGIGSSAGGLIMGVMANQYSHLFGAIIMRHPFLDPLHTLQQPALPLTIHEYEEFGNPTDPNVLAYLRLYSPCSNISDRVYPNLMITTGAKDIRVSPSESVQYVAGVRERVRARKVRERDETAMNREGDSNEGMEVDRMKISNTSSTSNPNSSPNPNEPLILLHVMPNTGHEGPPGAEEQSKLMALEIAFMERVLG